MSKKINKRKVGIRNLKRNLKREKKEQRKKNEMKRLIISQQNKKREYSSVLWSIPQPEEHTFGGRGYKNLFHYTVGNKLPKLLKYGIIFGDVMTDNLEGFNAPNLTTENQYHIPSGATNQYIKNYKYYRLTIKCFTDADKLINYGWFDKTYCKGINRKVTSTDPSRYGEIDKQYIYKGHITPSMIAEVKVWNQDTQYWDRPTIREIDDLCVEDGQLPYLDKSLYQPSQLRMCGFSFNDYTGMVEEYFAENDHKDVYKDWYYLTDYLCKKFKGETLKKYRMNILVLLSNPTAERLNNLFYGVLDHYNSLVDKTRKIDPYLYGTESMKKHKEWLEWLEKIQQDEEIGLVELKLAA